MHRVIIDISCSIYQGHFDVTINNKAYEELLEHEVLKLVKKAVLEAADTLD